MCKSRFFSCKDTVKGSIIFTLFWSTLFLSLDRVLNCSGIHFIVYLSMRLEFTIRKESRKE